jgi:hypothetical protein
MCKLTSEQGCRMAYFQTKITNLGKFWRVLQWKMLVSYSHFGIFVCNFGVFYGHLVYFSRFGMLYQEKSGNPASESQFRQKKGKNEHLQ